MPYGYSDIIRAYETLEVPRGGIVYVMSALWQVADYTDAGADALAPAHYEALREYLGAGGTIVVPTFNLNLCNTDIPFEPATTASHNRGVFTEYVRQRPEARRSFHPFGSYAAIGPEAEAITARVARHVYGPETPEARMIERNATAVLIGADYTNCSTVHHVEQLMGVPYRYTKEFIHPVARDGKIVREPFYMYVMYRDIGVERNHNKKLFARIGAELDIRTVRLGNGRIHAYAMADFAATASIALADDIYLWCERPPEERPYRT